MESQGRRKNFRLKKTLGKLVTSEVVIRRGNRYWDLIEGRWAERELYKTKYKAGYVVRCRLRGGVIVKDAYTVNGEYIGPSSLAHRLIVQLNIWPECGLDGGMVGWCKEDGKWYGWSREKGIKGYKDKLEALAYGRGNVGKER